jgi:Golgi phosphoprotein 3 (GPP34)
VGLTRVRAVLLAEDLLLLLLPTDDIRGRFSTSGDVVDIMLEGATLVELALMGRVEISREVKPVRFGRIHWDDRKVDLLIVGDSSPTGDAVLDAALQDVIAWQGKLSVNRKGRHRAGRSLTETLRMRLLGGG